MGLKQLMSSGLCGQSLFQVLLEWWLIFIAVRTAGAHECSIGVRSHDGPSVHVGRGGSVRLLRTEALAIVKLE